MVENGLGKGEQLLLASFVGPYQVAFRPSYDEMKLGEVAKYVHHDTKAPTAEMCHRQPFKMTVKISNELSYRSLTPR